MKKVSKQQIFILIFTVIVFLIGGGIIVSENISSGKLIASISADSFINNCNIMDLEVDEGGDDNEGDNGEIKKQLEKKKVFVHVAGEVINPGVYELNEGSRVIDALQLAGGATSEADLNIINLAAFISDGQQIYVPSIEESSTKTINYSSYIMDSGNSSGKVNINTAGLTELQSLSGIGPGKAQSIIEYRNKNGSFNTIEELLNVSGIGEKTFEKIKDKIILK